jgi:hypothetical protein
VPQFYDRYFFERYRLLDGQMDYQHRGIDTLIFTGTGAVTHVEEKFTRKAHTAFACETIGCTIPGRERPGYMAYSEAERLLYCFAIETGLDCWWIDMPALQAWFWPREPDFPPFQMETRNRTFGRVVNITVIPAEILIRNFQLRLPP